MNPHLVHDVHLVRDPYLRGLIDGSVGATWVILFPVRMAVRWHRETFVKRTHPGRQAPTTEVNNG